MTRTVGRRGIWLMVGIAGLLLGSPAFAQGPAAPEAGAPAAPPAAAEPIAPSTEAESAVESPVEEEVDPFTRISELEARLEQMRTLVVGHQPRVVVGGYLDIGYFVPQGNGSGIYRDVGNVLFPEYAGRFGWVFLGDILSTAVNSRGEVADLDDPTGAPNRFDSIHSGGAPGFVANEVNMTLTSGLGPSAIASASINFVPRSGSNFALGDFVDVDIAQLEWMPTQSQKTSLFVGKVDSVIGIEYRGRKAPQRYGITPSLIARYTTGTALGVKVRSKFGPDDMLVVAGAVTNGSFTWEQFHFYDEIDTNLGKTASGRISIHPPIPVDMELGLSGSYGPQDRSPNDNGKMWFWGVDYQLHFSHFDLNAQYLKGKAPGDDANNVFGLNLNGGGYVELIGRLTSYFGVMARGEYRDAFVWLTTDRAYVTKSWRATGTIHVNIGDRVILKAEYLHNGEYGRVAAFDNDVFTTSLVLIN